MLSIKFVLSAVRPNPNLILAKHITARTMVLSSHTLPLNNHKENSMNGINRIQKCNIFSESILMINKLETMQSYKSQQFGPDKPRYIERIKRLVDSGDMDMVLRDDLINMIGLADSIEHIELIEKIVEARVKSHPIAEEKGWGSALVRIYYKHGLTDRALKNIQDTERFGDFFAQMSCYRIVMTMLYNENRHQDVLDTYDLFCERKPGLDPENQELFVYLKNRLKFIVLASCARMNSPESLARAKTLELDDRSARSTMFIAYLALSQDDPKLALDYISRSEKANHIAIRSLKINSYLKIKRFEDVLIMIHRSLDIGARGKQILLQETCDLIEQQENEIEDESVRKELIAAIKDLKDNGLVSDSTIESFVFKEMTFIQKPTDDQTPDEDRRQGERYVGGFQQDRGQDRYRDRTQERSKNRFQDRYNDRNQGRFSDRTNHKFEDRYNNDTNFQSSYKY